ncbi:LIM zinc-binding domain-containing Nebulette [Paragonimus heterotremus]|uniref:LIM zinc-binding domain-containing Nebulette n=1 Tax=Paragonimus heterotremus TaxID=100268 RepID=A0A8J4WZL8_9TREM|nr:LIM zinc-binding domain-containing Nebulette [Paragonimus heterotremus]
MSANKPCTQCKEIVYPLEQIKCLDQIWHRKCFRCHSCGMALNMSSYRGYEKKPYCSAHYPQPKRFTVISDTPELQRVAQNTRILSNINYNQRLSRTSGLDRQHRPVSLNNCLSDNTIEQAPKMGVNTESTQPVGPRNTFSYSNISGGSNRTNGHGKDGTSRYYSTSMERVTREPSGPNHVGQVDHPSQRTNRATTQSQVVVAPTLPADGDTRFRAMYDYEAKEEDEVSFIEGDVILNGDPITDGWMYGTVQRTGQFGMLPSNYVEPI